MNEKWTMIRSFSCCSEWFCGFYKKAIAPSFIYEYSNDNHQFIIMVNLYCYYMIDCIFKQYNYLWSLVFRRHFPLETSLSHGLLIPMYTEIWWLWSQKDTWKIIQSVGNVALLIDCLTGMYKIMHLIIIVQNLGAASL